jgi:heat shock protein beta
LGRSRDVFIRELLSNSNDALEKTRLLSLTDPSILTTAPELNITVTVDALGGRIVIRGAVPFIIFHPFLSLSLSLLFISGK